MSHVFRLHKEGGAATLQGWDDSNGYGKKAIDSIVDPQGATYKREITSIPSPFARIDLVKNAFRQVVESKDLDNQLTIHHKIVSDCLDVAEIFFNIDKLRDYFEIIRWSKTDSLDELKNDSNPAHRQLALTLEMYLSQDGKQYNFDKMQNIYMLNYIGPDAPAQMNIVGATSPATLFFTSANDLSYVSKHVQFGNDKPFDSDFQPLYKRDEEFVKFWFGLKNLWRSISGREEDFSDLFKEVDKYLDSTYEKLPDALKSKIRNLDEQSWGNFSSIEINTVDDVVEILGCELKCKNLNAAFESDFYIDSEFKVNGKTPLVLPVDTFRKPLVYTQDIWDSKTIVPKQDPLPLEKRKLPNDGRVYPYLTIGDFLEDTIICNEHPLNSSLFYDGRKDEKNKERYSYLLPVKEFFFQCFKTEELDKLLEITESSVNDSKTVKVTLRIPITNKRKERKLITYERLYTELHSENSGNDDGLVLVKNFALHLMPFLKMEDNEADYRIIVADLVTTDDFQLSVANNGEKFKSEATRVRNEDADGKAISSGHSVYAAKTFLFNKQFTHIYFGVKNDAVAADSKLITNVIVPKFKGSQFEGKNFKFAVDFGTSNTHIEYSVDDGNIRPFSISKVEGLIVPLNEGYGRLYTNVMKADFLPEEIGKEYKFPTRTVLSEKCKLNWNLSVIAMAETNIPLAYQSIPLPRYNRAYPDLKWARDTETKSRIRSYIENIMILLRNKVLLNGGDLSATKIAWFFPSSMSNQRVSEIGNSWISLYKRYFGGSDTNVIRMSESVVPYLFYKKENSATTDVVSIDIGGGTSDILFAQNGEEKYLTSIRFAANSIFDCIKKSSNSPFIKKYKAEFYKMLEGNGMTDIKNLIDGMVEEEDKVEEKANYKVSTSDVVMLLFSLSSNKDVIANNLVDKFDYSAKLFADSRLKILFLLFYTALIYHVAKIVKIKGLKEPRHLTFSGTGSKVLNILTDPRDKSTLEKFTMLIFEKVLGRKYQEDGLDIIINVKNPKEVTCKGALLDMQPMDANEIEDMKYGLLGTVEPRSIKDMKYEDIKDDILDGVAKEIKNFTTLFYNLNREFSFNKKFGTVKTEGLDSLNRYFERDIKKYVIDGIGEEKSPKDELEESLFFYPIKGILGAIAGDKSMLDRDE